jgi:integrase
MHMAQNFLISSRHGSIFYFRRRVPEDLKAIIGKSFLVKTLATTSKAAAIVLARVYAAKTDAIYERLRTMKKSRPDSIQFDYTLEFSMDDEGKPKFKIDATPEETQAVSTVIATALQNFPIGPRTSIPSQPTRPLLDAKSLLDDFFREGTGGGRWKDPNRTRCHDYEPIWKRFSPHAEKHGLTLEAAKAYRSEVIDSALSPETKHRNMYRVHAVIAFGVDRHALDTKMLKELKMPTVKGRGKNSRARPYHPFTQAELELLFHSEAYKNNSFKKPSHFWLPMLGLYTGARIEELAGLHLSAFNTVDEVPAVVLSDEDTTDGGKNAHATRQVPLHKELIQAGLMAYVEKLKSEGFDRLFPDIGNAERDGYGKRATNDFIEYRRSVGVGQGVGVRSRKVFHSFRSTLAGKFFDHGVDGDLSRRLTGHAPLDVHQGTYLAAAAIPIKRASLAMNEMSFGLSHPLFSDTSAYVKARNRKKRV